METLVVESFTQYYGLDWLALLCGLFGTWLITKKNRIGFAFSAVSSMSGFTVAIISLQFGFVIYNFLIFGLMLKGFKEWGAA